MSAHEASALHGPDALPTAARRRDAAAAGHRGDEPTARAALEDPEGSVRATALGALVRMSRDTLEDFESAIADGDPTVRRRSAELAARSERNGEAVGRLLVERLAAAGGEHGTREREAAVVEAVCFSLGELQPPGATAVLAGIAAGHPEPLCRESAVAAIGAIGDPEGLATILAALDDRPAIRRRAVLALAAYEGPQVDAALQRALEDRDWQVRQAAEDLSGR